jgi:hypothetical protein
VALVAAELMEGEVSAEIGAELGEVAPDARLTPKSRLYVSAVTGVDPMATGVLVEDHRT